MPLEGGWASAAAAAASCREDSGIQSTRCTGEASRAVHAGCGASTRTGRNGESMPLSCPPASCKGRSSSILHRQQRQRPPAARTRCRQKGWVITTMMAMAFVGAGAARQRDAGPHRPAVAGRRECGPGHFRRPSGGQGTTGQVAQQDRPSGAGPDTLVFVGDVRSASLRSFARMHPRPGPPTPHSRLQRSITSDHASTKQRKELARQQHT